MKKLILIICFTLLFAPVCYGADTYLSSTATEAGCAGTGADPCRELDHIQTAGSGDNIYLKCGDTWTRTSGSWGSVYGSGTNMEINIGDSASVDGLVVGAYYFDDPNYRIVDGVTYNCPGTLPTIDGEVTDFSAGHTLSYAATIAIRAASGRTTKNVTIQDLKIVNYISGVVVRPRDGGSGLMDNIIVQRIHVDTVGKTGMRAVTNPNSVSPYRITNVYFLDSTVENSMLCYSPGYPGESNWGVAIVLRNIDGGVISGNLVNKTMGEGINTHSCSRNIDVYNNIVVNSSSMGIYPSATQNSTFHHNIAIHTDDDWDTGGGRANGAMGFGSEGDCDKQPDTSCTDWGCVDSSGVYMWANVGIGYDVGMRVHDGEKGDGDDTGDGLYGVNKAYNNTLIDNDQNWALENNVTNEVWIEFQNNLSVITATGASVHTNGQTINTDLYTMLGNGWDESLSVTGTGWCTGGSCTSGGDVTGDPDLVDPGPCSGNWRSCAAYTDIEPGDAALGAASDFLNNAATLASTFDDGLGPTSEWPDSVVTLDQDLYGAGWEFGAYVYGAPVSTNAFSGMLPQGCIFN